jgi:hypothetical protein
MTNISITSLCNRSCSYCFAAGAFGTTREHDHMSRECFASALDFLQDSGIEQARLLGGEPTLHPDFPFFVNQVLARGLRLLVFTNGLMPDKALNALARTTEEQAGILINAAAQGQVTMAQQERLNTVMNQLGPRAVLGFNITSAGVRLDFLLDRIDRWKLARTLRLGLAHPCISHDNHYLHPNYYSRVGDTILSFAALAGARNIALEFDCGFVPCMFPAVGLERLGKTVDAIGRRCNPLPDILPDGRVIPCYALAGLCGQSLWEQHAAKDVQKRFEEQLAVYTAGGIFQTCSICTYKTSGQCNGGCLAGAIRRIRQSSFSLSIEKRGRERKSSEGATTRSRPARSVDDAALDGSPAVQARWLVPYIDQPASFWQKVADKSRGAIKGVYFPLPGHILASGRPVQPDRYLDRFLKTSPFALTALINPIILPRPAEEMAPRIIEALKRLHNSYGLREATVSDLMLAEAIREALPGISLTASVLMDIYQPNQALMLDGIIDTLVPASRIMRNTPALKQLKQAFSGKIRLIVNEACLSACPFRLQHFCEMGRDLNAPPSLCTGLLDKFPWMRLTGAWVLPQHLHFYDGLYDELKISGRVTLKNPDHYFKVLDAYFYGKTLSPDSIGGGPASPVASLTISAEFYAQTLTCGHQCHQCKVCSTYYSRAVRKNESNRKTHTS